MDLMDYRRKIIANSPHLASASGAIATFSDGADLPLKSLNVDIEPVQDLHGYDYPWPAGGGKNLLHITRTSTTVNGVTFTVNSDGTIGVNGTATANMDFSLYSSASDGGKTGSYILSSDVINSSNTYKLVGRVTNTSTSTRRYINTKDGEMLIATGENEIIDSIYINVQSGTTVNNVVFKPMLRLSSVSDSTYAPYENICPISGWNGVKVTRTGKNVFDNQFSNNTINGLTWVLNSDGTITVNGTATAETQLHTQFVSGIEGEYYFSGCPSGGSSTSYDVFIWDVTNSRRAKKWNRTTAVDSELGGGNAQVYLGKGLTYRFCYRIRNGYTANNVLFSPMIRPASFTDKTYEPYNGVNVISNGKNLFSTFEDGDTTSSGVTFDFSNSDVVKISGTSTATNASSQKKIIGGTDAPTPIEFTQGNTYTISVQGTVSVSKANDFRIILLSNSNTILWYGDSTNGVWTFTPESTFVAERIMFRIKSNGTTVNVDAHLQIELGSTATSYEPHQIFYGGTLNPLTGVMTVDRAMVTLDENTQISELGVSIIENCSQISYVPFISNGKHGAFVSNIFEFSNEKGLYQIWNSGNASIPRMFLGLPNTVTTRQEAVAWFAEHPTQVVCYIATPITYQLTPQQIRSLYGNNTIYADTGNVALEYWAHA